MQESIQRLVGSDRFVLLVLVILIIVLSYSIYNMSMRTGEISGIISPDATNKSKGIKRTLLAPGAREIASWQLFGVETSKKKTTAQAPETRLKLTLSGVIVVDDKKLNRAIIIGKDKREKTYGLGDKVPGGASIEEIHPDRVILFRNGQYETLRLPKDKLKQQKTPGINSKKRS